MLFAVRGRFHRGKDCASVVGRKTSSQCVVGTTIAHIGNLLSPFVEIFVSISLVVVEMSRKEVQKKADSARLSCFSSTPLHMLTLITAAIQGQVSWNSDRGR